MPSAMQISDHFFNAMTGLHHRDIGVVGWALTKPDVTFDIIADGIHVAPEILKFAAQTKSTEKSFLNFGCGFADGFRRRRV